MGTNYYWYQDKPCKCCGREYSPIHIGKSSYGWCFSLHIYPELGINTLEDWREKFYEKDSYIEDEYKAIISPAEMLSTIQDRKHPRKITWSKEEFDKNQAIPGPNNLVRHKIGGHCIGNGPGTWDYITGEFC